MGASSLRAALALAFAVALFLPAAPAVRASDPLEALGVMRPAAPTPAPDVAFRSVEGREVRLRDLRGRPILLGFFTTW